eukprot:29149-Pelagococcus_subviridis.AAC.6
MGSSLTFAFSAAIASRRISRRAASRRSSNVNSRKSMMVANSSLSISPSSLTSAAPKFMSSSSSSLVTLSPTIFAAFDMSSSTMHPLSSTSKHSNATSSASSVVASAMRSVTVEMNSPRSTVPPPSSSIASRVAFSSSGRGSNPNARAANLSSFSSMSPPLSVSTNLNASVSSVTSSVFNPCASIGDSSSSSSSLPSSSLPSSSLPSSSPSAPLASLAAAFASFAALAFAASTSAFRVALLSAASSTCAGSFASAGADPEENAGGDRRGGGLHSGGARNPLFRNSTPCNSSGIALTSSPCMIATTAGDPPAGTHALFTPTRVIVRDLAPAPRPSRDGRPARRHRGYASSEDEADVPVVDLTLRARRRELSSRVVRLHGEERREQVAFPKLQRPRELLVRERHENRVVRVEHRPRTVLAAAHRGEPDVRRALGRHRGRERVAVEADARRVESKRHLADRGAGLEPRDSRLVRPPVVVLGRHRDLRFALFEDVKRRRGVALGEHGFVSPTRNLLERPRELVDARDGNARESGVIGHRVDRDANRRLLVVQRPSSASPAHLPLPPEPIIRRGFIFAPEREHHLPCTLRVARLHHLRALHRVSPPEERVVRRRAVQKQHHGAQRLRGVDDVPHLRGSRVLRRGGAKLILHLGVDAAVQ